MAIRFTKETRFAGGALGAIERRINATQKTLEEIAPGHDIRFDPNGENSIKISHAGNTGGERWSGKAYSEGNDTPVVDVDLADPANIEGKYICINAEEGTWEWADAPKAETGWHSFKVAEKHDTPPSANEIYYLTADTCGDIVYGSMPFPIKADDPPTGFEFVPNEAEGESGLIFQPLTPALADVLTGDGTGGCGWVPGFNLAIGTVSSGSTAGASITGENPDKVLNLVLPKGDDGEGVDLDGTYISSVTPTLEITGGKLRLTLAFAGLTVTDGVATAASIEDAVTEIDIEECP